MTTDFPTAPPAYGLEGPSAGRTVEKSPSASHTKNLTPPVGTRPTVRFPYWLPRGHCSCRLPPYKRP